MAELRKALFLDRDGTINVDPGYINHPGLLELLPGAAAAIRRAREAGYAIVVVTNQSGVGRGLIPPEMLPRIHLRMNELLLAAAGARIDHFACCTHQPSDGCSCRKPLPRLVHEAAEKLGLALDGSAFIGDRLTDVATGKAAGVGRTLLVRTGDGKAQEALLEGLPAEQAPDFVAESLGEAVDWVLGRPVS